MQASLMGMASFLSSSLACAMTSSSVASESIFAAVSAITTGWGATAPAARRAGRLPPQRSAKLMIGKSIAVRMAYL